MFRPNTLMILLILFASLGVACQVPALTQFLFVPTETPIPTDTPTPAATFTPTPIPTPIPTLNIHDIKKIPKQVTVYILAAEEFGWDVEVDERYGILVDDSIFVRIETNDGRQFILEIAAVGTHWAIVGIRQVEEKLTPTPTMDLNTLPET